MRWRAIRHKLCIEKRLYRMIQPTHCDEYPQDVSADVTASVYVKTLTDQVYNYRVKFKANKLGCSMYGMVYTWD